MDLTVSSGRTILLGPNGAGKTTLLSLAASVLRLTSGSVTIGGTSPTGQRGTRDYRRRVAWMPQTVTAAAGLTAREQVALHGWLAGMSKGRAWDEALGALGRVDLVAHAGQRASALSGGQRARMGLAQALVHGADVVLLDEPTAALDPDQRQSFGDLLAEVSVGRNVIVSSHDVSDIADSYDSVVVMDAGRVRFQGSVSAFLCPAGADLSAVDAYRRILRTERDVQG